MSAYPPLEGPAAGRSKAPPPGGSPAALDSLTLVRFTFGLLSFFHGLNEASRLSLFYFQKDVLHLGADAMQQLASLMVIPQFAKPFAGFFLDRYLDRGRSLLALLTVLELLKCALGLWLGVGPLSAPLFVTLVLLRRTLLIADALIAEAVLGSLTRERVLDRADPQANEFPVFFIWKGVGGVAGLTLSSFLIAWCDNRASFLVSAATPVCVILFLRLFVPHLDDVAVSVRAAETRLRESSPPDRRETAPLVESATPGGFGPLSAVLSVLRSPGVFPVLVFAMLLSLNPEFGHVVEVYATEVLQFAPGHLAAQFILHSSVIALAVLCYARLTPRLTTKPFFALSVFAAACLHVAALLVFSGSLLTLGLPLQRCLAVLTFACLSTLEDINMPAVFAHVSRFCPAAAMATTLATVSCLVRASWHFAQYAGGLLTRLLEIQADCFARAWLIPVVNGYYLCLVFMLLLVLPFREAELPPDAPGKSPEAPLEDL